MIRIPDDNDSIVAVDPVDLAFTMNTVVNESFVIYVTGAAVSSLIGTLTVTYQYEGEPAATSLSYIAVDYPEPGVRT